MNYGIFFAGSPKRSGSYPEAFDTRKEARAAINSGKPLALEPKEYEIRPLVDAKTRRNNQQRARRASPEAKAAEARARRRSYWRKKEGYGQCGWDSSCSICAQLKADHDL